MNDRDTAREGMRRIAKTGTTIADVTRRHAKRLAAVTPINSGRTVGSVMAENPRHCSFCDEYADKIDSVTVIFQDTGQAASFNTCDEHCLTITIGQMRTLAEERRGKRHTAATARRRSAENR